MKKLMILLTVVLAVSLSACGDNNTSDKKEETNAPVSTETAKTPDATEASSETETESAPINLCDGKLYGGMPEADAMAYMETELGLTKTRYIDSGDFTQAFYAADDWFGLGDTLIDIQSKNGALKYIEFIFNETTSSDLIAEISNRFGSDHEIKEYSTYKKHTWYFSDAHARILAHDEERDTVSFFVTYVDLSK